MVSPKGYAQKPMVSPKVEKLASRQRKIKGLPCLRQRLSGIGATDKKWGGLGNLLDKKQSSA
jgi:hypothetical protein